jgi:hypothetical protein
VCKTTVNHERASAQGVYTNEIAAKRLMNFLADFAFLGRATFLLFTLVTIALN